MKTVHRLQLEIEAHTRQQRLLKRVQRLVNKWQPILGVKISEIHVRTMKTYWASINEADSRMWISRDLADYPTPYLECVIVHEMVHMRTDGHDSKFYALMDRHLPGWRKTHARFAGPMTRHN